MTTTLPIQPYTSSRSDTQPTKVMALASQGRLAMRTVAIGAQHACAWVASVIQDLVTTLISLIALAAVFPVNLERFDPKKREQCDPNQTPILLIHGFLGSSNNWVYIRYRLLKARYKNVFTINLGDPRKSIHEYAQKVSEKVKAIETLTGRKDVVLVGHSMGGLVAQQYLYEMSPDQSKVKKVITIVTPCLGTPMARLAAPLSTCAKLMVPSSPLLQSQQAKVAADPTTPYCRIAAAIDWIVFPQSSALGMPNARKTEYVIPAKGHASVLFSPKVADLVINELTTAV